MRAGKLDRTIIIEGPAPVQTTPLGQRVPGWAPIATRRAMVTPVRDAERFNGSEVQATLTHRFTVRWDAGLWAAVNPKCRVQFEGRVYGIAAVKEIGRREGIEITATARAE